MSADSVLPQSQTTGAAWFSKTCPPPCPETIGWFQSEIRPALKNLADSSELIRFSFLHEAARKLPAADQPAWRDLVRRLEIATARQRSTGHPDQLFLVRFFKASWTVLRRGFRDEDRYITFVKLLDELNTSWFLPRSLLLYHYAEDRLADDLTSSVWPAAKVALAATTYAQVYPFAGGTLPVYIVRHLLPRPVPSIRSPCFYDPIARMVVIDENHTDKMSYEVKVAARADDLLTDYLCLIGRWERSTLAIEKCFCQRLDKRYPQLQDFRSCYCFRVLIEELRHGMDAMRADPFVLNEEYDRRFGETLLARNGRVRQLFWEAAQSDEGEALLRGESVQAVEVVSELSAQMTAAAIGDPGMVLLEWWRKLALLASCSADPVAERLTLSPYPNHTLAAILGTIFLDERLNCGSPLSWSMLCEPDFAALADLAWKLVNRPVRELRLALQAVYRDEFNHPIDELPFAEILPTGAMRTRLADEPDGTLAGRAGRRE